MAVDRDGEHVGAVVEDLLLAVAVVIVDVEDGDACRSATSRFAAIAPLLK